MSNVVRCSLIHATHLQSFATFLESDATEPDAPLSLSRLLASAFTIHGTHFTILKQLHPTEAYEFHNKSLDWITGRLGQYITQERSNKSRDVKQRCAIKRARALTFFRCLTPLTAPLNGRDALKLRGEAEQWLEERLGMQRETIINAKGKQWEPYKAYEKRLVLIASRDENVKKASHRVVKQQQQREMQADDSTSTPTRKKVSNRARAGLTEEDEAEDVGLEGDEGRSRTMSASPITPRAGARTTPIDRKNGLVRTKSISHTETTQEETGDGEEEDGEEEVVRFRDLDAEEFGMELDLDNDAEFNDAHFGAMLQGSRGTRRPRSPSAEPAARTKRTKQK